MSLTRSSLRLLPGERRNHERFKSQPEDMALVSGAIGIINLEEVEIQSIEFGRVILKVNKDHKDVFKNLPSEQLLDLRLRDSILISGMWLVSLSRESDDHLLVVLNHPDVSLLRKISDHLDREHLLRADRLRLLRLDRPSELKEIEHHFTDLMDFKSDVPCRISLNGEHFKAKFSFESKSKSLSELHIAVEDQVSLTQGQEIKIEYKFLTVRYLINTTVQELDRDFGLVIVKFPQWLVAVTSRRYDRRTCDIDVKARLADDNNTEFNAQMISCSVTGGSIIVPAEVSSISVGDDLTIAVPSLEAVARARIRSVRKQTVGFEFLVSEGNFSEIRKIFNATIIRPLVIREPSNFELFSAIYRRVGYGPKKEQDEACWWEKTKIAWTLQDHAIPGNTTGAIAGKDLAISFSILPMSNNVAYGHSLAMDKSIHSIEYFLEIASINLGFAELLEGVTHFAGSARLNSHFATRLHTVFECHAKPQTQQMFYARAILGKPETSGEPSSKYALSSDTVNYEAIPKSLKTIFKIMKNAHPSISSVHHLSHFQLKDRDSGKLIALVIAQTSPDYFTAADIFKMAWCFVIDQDADISEIYKAVLGDAALKNLELDIFSPDLTTIATLPTDGRDQEEVFWFIFEKEEMGPVLASVSRSAWAVVRKYGGDLLSYLERFVE